jgi:hypothetical protein
MNVRDVVKNAPNWVIAAIVGGVLITLGLIGAQVLLSLNGSGSDDLIRLVNTVFNAVSLLTGFGGVAFGAAAAKSAHRVEQKVAPEDDGTEPKA